MNKPLFTLITIFVLSLSFSVDTKAQEKSVLDTLNPTTKNCNYVTNKLYEPFSDITNSFPGMKNLIQEGKNNTDCINVTEGTENLLKNLFTVAISIIIILTVINISVSGIQYMTQEAVGKKGEAKKRLQNSFIALGLGLLSYTILYTVNKQLVNFNFNPSEIDIDKSVDKGVASANRDVGTFSTEVGGIEVLKSPSSTYAPIIPGSQPSFNETITNGNFSTYASFGSIKCGGKTCSSSKPTVFGYKDGDGTVGMTGDNGIGNASWSDKPGCTYDTGNTITMGVALPQGFWRAAGIQFADVKYIGVRVFVNGVFVKVLPVVDDSQSNLDFTFAAAKAYLDPTITNSNRLNTSGKAVTFEIIKDYYKSNPKTNVVYTSNKSTFSNKIPCNI